MSSDQEIEDYIRKGLARGFNIKHIRDVLMKAGHSRPDIDRSIRMILHPENVHNKREVFNKQRRNHAIIMVLVAVLIVVFSALVYVSFNEKPAAIDTLEKETFQQQLKQIDALSSEINQKQDNIEKQLTIIENMDSTLENKEQLIAEQIAKIRELNDYVKQERSGMRDLLLTIINSNFKRLFTQNAPAVD